jgi:hypothetical protein
MSSALTERTLGTCRLGGRPRPATGKTSSNADRPGQPACAQGLTELGAHAVPGVGEDRPEANAGGDQAIQFGERNLRLGSRRAIFGGTRRRARAELGRRSRPPEGTVVSPPSPPVRVHKRRRRRPSLSIVWRKRARSKRGPTSSRLLKKSGAFADEA